MTFLGAVASAEVISMRPGQFVVYAGQHLSTGSDVTIHGNVASFGSDVEFSRGVTVYGSVHADDDFKLYEDSTVTGAVYAADKVTLSKNTIAGALHGKYVTIGNDATTGALFASRNVKLGDRSIVNGSINAARDVELKKNSTVNGDVTYGHKLKTHSSATIAGLAARGTPIAPTPPLSTSVTQVAPDVWPTVLRDVPTFVYGRDNRRFARNSTSTLAPGTYRNLSVDRGATLTLTAGTYNFRDVWLGRGVRLIADTTGGDVVINSADDFGMDRDGFITRVGQGDVMLATGDDLYIGRNANVDATLRVYDDLSIDTYATVSRAVYAHEEVWLATGVRIIPSSRQPVPEPSAMLLLGAGGLYMALRRPKRRAV